jgi:ABC-type branched-subunit amino acid transport system substrate-binding protein
MSMPLTIRRSAGGKAITLAALALYALALGGCGGKVKELDHVKVGYAIHPLVKPLVDPIFEMVLEEYNARGPRVPVELVWLDTTDPDDPDNVWSPEGEARAIREFVEDPEAVAVWSSLNSDMAKASIPITNEAGMAQIVTTGNWAGLAKPGYGPGEPGIYYPTGVRNAFFTITQDDVAAELMVEFVDDYWGEVDSAYIIDTGGTSSRGYAGQFELAALDAGWEVIYDENNIDTMTSEDLDALAQRVVDAQLDIVYMMGDIRGIVYRIRELDPDMRITGTYMGNMVWPDYIPDGYTTDMLDGMINQEPFPDPTRMDTEAAAAFVAKWEAATGEEYPTIYAGQLIGLGYEPMDVILRAIEKADVITREGVLNSLKNFGTYHSYFGDWEFTPEGRLTLNASEFLVWEDGEWTPLKTIVTEVD